MATGEKNNSRPVTGVSTRGQPEDVGRPVASAHECDERLRALTKHLADSITVVDRDGVIRYDSPHLQHFLGNVVGGLV